MEIDPDTLQKYNWEKYKNQSDLYYKILPAGTYTLDADSWTIPSGELNATAAIKNRFEQDRGIREACMMIMYFHFASLLRLVNLWGRTNIPKCWHISGLKMIILVRIVEKVLLRSKETTYTTEITSTQLYAINNNICYMFVGEKTRANTPDYLNYVVEIKRDEWGGIYIIQVR